MCYSNPECGVDLKVVFNKTVPLEAVKKSMGRRLTPISADENKRIICVHQRSSAECNHFFPASHGRGFLRGGSLALVLALVAAMVVPRIGGQQPPGFPAAPLPEKTGPLRPALLLLRQGKTAEARALLEQQRKQRPDDAEVLYQIARSYLIDFYKEDNPDKRTTLALAMEMLDSTLKRNADHIPA